jgi:protein-disulfide isomerase
MKASVLLACAIVLAPLAWTGSSAIANAPASASKARDWTRVVRTTPAGGFVMGNPDAKVKLVEYGSMTCPHCKRFDDAGVPHILDYVKTGRVSYEFRNYVRDPFDLSAALVARCAGPHGFFALTRALYDDQQTWVGKIERTPQDQLKAMQDLPPNRQFVAIAKVAGFPQFAAAHGLAAQKSAQCLSNLNSVKQLVEMNAAATNQYPDFRGTPTFILNGQLVDLGEVTEAQVWPALKEKIDAALGARS